MLQALARRIANAASWPRVGFLFLAYAGLVSALTAAEGRLEEHSAGAAAGGAGPDRDSTGGAGMRELMTLHAIALVGLVLAACSDTPATRYTSDASPPTPPAVVGSPSNPPAPSGQGAGAPVLSEMSDAASSAPSDYLHERVASHDRRFFAVSEYDRSVGRSTLQLESSDGSPARVLVDLRAFRVKDSSLDPEIVAGAQEILLSSVRAVPGRESVSMNMDTRPRRTAEAPNPAGGARP